jgi:RNA polymerase sigma factor (sigma-70 family)
MPSHGAWSLRGRELAVTGGRTIRNRRRIDHGVPVDTTQPKGLVERIQTTGDLDAFEEFFNTYKRPVYVTALAITRDPFLAEEILQDCFVKAYRVRHRLRTDVSPLPWLQRVCTNLCYTRVARRRALAEPITALITNLVTDLTSRPEQVVESREIIEVLQRGIDALPPKQQTAVILYYLHGYSLAEAAEIAACNVGTMKSRLHYALKALRGSLPIERGTVPEGAALAHHDLP